MVSLTNIRYAKTAENFGFLVFFSAQTDCSIHKILDFPEVEFLGLRGPLAVPLSARPPLCAGWGLGVPQHFVPRQNVPVHILSQNNAGSCKVVFLLVPPPKVEDGKNPTKKVKVSGL